MRTALVAIAVLVMWTASAPAQGWAEKMFTAGTTHDFGTVPRGTQSVHRFKIQNIYAVPMDITELKASCGCVSATSPKRTLAPREESYIEVRMDGRRYTGHKAVTIMVTVGPRFISSAQLRVSATGRSDVVFNPGEVNFGLVNQGTAVVRTVDVEYAGALPWTVTEVVSADSAFTVSAAELYRRVGRVGYRLTVTLKKDAPAGPIKNEIVLKTNDPASPTVPLFVEGIVQSSLTVQPSSLSLGPVKVGEALTRRVVVRGASPFKVLKVEADGDGAEVVKELGTEAKTVHLIDLSLKPNAEGAFRWTLKVQTDAQDAPLTIAIDGSGTK